MNKEENPESSGKVLDIDHQIEELGPWFHNLHLPNGTQTAPNHFLGDFPLYKWQQIVSYIPENLEGWKILDIGCNAGFYSIELARRGAQVLGIDHDLHYLKQAQWAAHHFNLEHKIEFRHMQVYDLIRTPEQYDLVLFMGVFYHLRYPLLGLDIVSQKVKNLLVFQTLSLSGEEPFSNVFDCGIHHRDTLCQPGWPKMAFVENYLNSDPTNWWVPNHACIEAMLRTCGLRVIARPGDEIYLCRADPSIPSNAMTWNLPELLSATGMSDPK
jgi:tRNA (mo5U34)-methyltransferase